jgi:uroporphyrinogen decarboxylase
MNKREAVLSLLDAGQKPAYIPAAFFLHFDPAYRSGQAAVDKHLEFFQATGMDFVKIQYEHTFPHLPSIQKVQDWAKAPLYKEDFFAEPLRVVQGLVKAARSEALVVMTLYSPFMLARQTTSDSLLTEHMRENPEAVKKGLQVITESLLYFVRGCKQAGVDGFYVSTQGGEAGRFKGTPLFEEHVKPYDLAVWNEIGQSCAFNILHVCDYQGSYADYSAYLDYPGQVVNCSLKLADKTITAQEASDLFKRPFMGGIERLGVIASGSPEQVRLEAEKVMAEAPDRFILAADCTVPAETPWENLRSAIDAAHTWAAPAGGTRR